MTAEPQDWRIYRGSGEPHDGIDRLPEPPPWRRFESDERAVSYQADPHVVDRVNAAILLRRPLLVTGKAGTGKSTLAHNIAHELGLGPALTWSITSKTTLGAGLYEYDAIGRVHESSMRLETTDIGRYIRLGPLGTALLPGERPRVLLIDELDKSDIDLPNDLLGVLEEGTFRIPELERLPEEQEVVEVMADGADARFPIRRGRVQCAAFPIVVITSNGEREFPPAFLRRCVRLSIQPPLRAQLARIVEAHLGQEGMTAGREIISRFLVAREKGELATDQLLNAIFLAVSGSRPPQEELDGLVEAILRPLDIAGSG